MEPEIRITADVREERVQGGDRKRAQGWEVDNEPWLFFAKPKNSIKKSIILHHTFHKSMFSSSKPVVENTEENRQICRKYCTICQNYKRHSLEKYQPTELFCGCGTSSAPSMKEIGCFCPACELFSKHHLRGGYFCVRH
jgi:hypothetical protein